MEAALIGPNGRTTLATTVLTIGRMPGNQLLMTDSQASSHHAEVRPDGQGYSIVDLGSTNGTFVNDQQLAPNAPRHLNAGDRIRIGETLFTYEATGEAAIAPTVYAGSNDQGNQPAFAPTVAVPPPSYTNYNANDQQVPPPPAYQPAPTPVYQAPYAPPAPPPYVPPPAGGYPAFAAPTQQKQSRRGLWLALSIAGAVLLLLCVSCSVFAYATRSTPEKTLSTFCDDLKSSNYHDAYQQFSSSFQARESEAQFTSSLSQAFAAGGGLSECTFRNVSDDGSVGTATVTFFVRASPTIPINEDDTRLVKESSSTWKIDFVRAKKQS